MLHLDFHGVYMNDVDIVLGYLWIDYVGTINITVQNKFLKLWYKKNTITLQDISLTKQEGPKGTHEKVIANKNNQYKGTWKTKSNAWTYHCSTTWNQRSNNNEDWGGNEAIGSHVHISLRWINVVLGTSWF